MFFVVDLYFLIVAIDNLLSRDPDQDAVFALFILPHIIWGNGGVGRRVQWVVTNQ